MGTNKALLRFPNGQTVIERIVSRAGPLCDESLIVTNMPEDYRFLDLPMFGDAYPGASSLGGIYTGLLHARGERALVLSCDLPLLNADLLKYLLDLAFDYDLLMPYVGARQQPLHAIYGKACLPEMRRLIEGGDLKIVRLLDSLRGRIVQDSDLRPEWLPSFRNMNTPDDWAEVLRLEAAQPG